MFRRLQYISIFFLTFIGGNAQTVDFSNEICNYQDVENPVLRTKEAYFANGFILDDKWKTVREKIVVVDIDIPLNCPELEAFLCKELYRKQGKSIKEGFKPFVDYLMYYSYNHPFFKEISGNQFNLQAYCLAVKPKSYYSYVCKIVVSKKLKDYIYIKNFVYDVATGKLLKVKDILTKEAISQFGLKNMKEIEIGLDRQYLYLGINSQNKPKWIRRISITEDNWNLFTQKMQTMIGEPYKGEEYYISGDFFGIQRWTMERTHQ